MKIAQVSPRAFLVLVLVLVLGSGVSFAATFSVMTTADVIHGSCGANCSLRDAVIAANAVPGSTVILPPGSFLLSISPNGSDDVTTGDLNITASVTIDGAGIGTTVIDGNFSDRILSIDAACVVLLQDLSMQNGKVVGGLSSPSDDPALGTPGADVYGGAILNEGGLTIRRCVFLNNAAVGGDGASGDSEGGTGGSARGGAIFSGGGPPLNIYDSAFMMNSATGGRGGDEDASDPGSFGGDGGASLGGSIAFAGTGGGFMSHCRIEQSTATGGTGGTGAQVGHGGPGVGGALLGVIGIVGVEFCEFASNSALSGLGGDGSIGTSAASSGGAAAGGENVELVVSNSTIAFNQVQGGPFEESSGGGISAGSLFLESCTVTGNQAPAGYGGGVSVDVALFQSSILVANGAAAYPDAYVDTQASGHSSYNLVGIGDGLPGDFDSTNMIGSVAEPLDAHLGTLGSHGGETPTIPLLLGSPAIDAVPAADCEFGTDQRDVTRPQGAGCDIGAFELETTTGNGGNSFTLSVQLGGTGSGTVASDPEAGISCPTDCSAEYFANSVISLSAHPANGSIFDGWSGGCGGPKGTTSVVMSSDQSCMALFQNAAAEDIPVLSDSGAFLFSLVLAIAGFAVMRRRL